MSVVGLICSRHNATTVITQVSVKALFLDPKLVQKRITKASSLHPPRSYLENSVWTKLYNISDTRLFAD